MSSPGGGDGGAISDAAGSPFPAVDVDGELHPGMNKHVEIDPISSEVAASLEFKEKARSKAMEEDQKEVKKKEAIQTLKTAFMVSGVVAAVAVAAFVVVKKLREN